jgi:hypothetical protein
MCVRALQFDDSAPGDSRVVQRSPQASIMKALREGFRSRQPVAYILFGAGAAIAVMMEKLDTPALILALGMYLPLELNTPALAGWRDPAPPGAPGSWNRGDRRHPRFV